MTYCLDFRKRVLSYKARHGLSFEATAAHFCISKSSLVRWLHRLSSKTRRNKGSVKIDMDLPRICQERMAIARLAQDVMVKKIGMQKDALM